MDLKINNTHHPTVHHKNTNDRNFDLINPSLIWKRKRENKICHTKSAPLHKKTNV